MNHKSRARAYQSLTPANNMILKRKWDQTTFVLHRAKVRPSDSAFPYTVAVCLPHCACVHCIYICKVRNAKAITDTKPPKTYMHLHLNLKKIQMEEERQAIIDRDNRILLEKMANIMKTNGQVDNRNEYKQRRYQSVVLTNHPA